MILYVGLLYQNRVKNSSNFGEFFMEVLKHGTKYKTCVCDKCNAEIGYYESEVKISTFTTPLSFSEYKRNQKLIDDGIKNIIYVRMHIICPECKNTISLDSKTLCDQQAEIFKKYGIVESN